MASCLPFRHASVNARSLTVVLTAAVIDESSQTLFLTEMFRGLNLTLKAFFDRKVTVRLPWMLMVRCMLSRNKPLTNVSGQLVQPYV